MKKLVLSVGACTLLMPGFAAAKDKTFTGEIMDSQCAKNSSHTMMLKKEGMGDKDPNDPMVKQMCTKNCVKMGGKYVLYNAAKKTIYERPHDRSGDGYARRSNENHSRHGHQSGFMTFQERASLGAGPPSS